MWKILSGVVLGWSLGANNSANIFGTGVTTGTVLGSLASVRLANRMDERFLSKAIALVLGFLGVMILLFFIR